MSENICSAQPMETSDVPKVMDPRRHDLDALRAFAMLLGIGLHSALSFFQVPWPVQDIHQHKFFGIFMQAVHGFRMPLFFLLSGFFTMMVYRKKGLKSLLWQRAVRIFIPCMLCLFTVVPLVDHISKKVIHAGSIRVHLPEETLAAAIRSGDRQAINLYLSDPDEISRADGKLGVYPLTWAALKGDLETVEELLSLGADVNQVNKDGSTALHGAAFLGRDTVAKFLIEQGARLGPVNQMGLTPFQSTFADIATTKLIAGHLGIALPEEEALKAGRNTVRGKLFFGQLMNPFAKKGDAAKSEAPPAKEAGNTIYRRYQEWLNSGFFVVTFRGHTTHLVRKMVFHHLWFLWYLCWMVLLFALLCPLFKVVSKILPAQWLRSLQWFCMLALVPGVVVPLLFMNSGGLIFGPDTSTGIIPPPHLLGYYLIFFLFGCLYFEVCRSQNNLMNHWLLFLVGLLVIFPMGYLNMNKPWVNIVAQALYVWAMSLGLMGIFARWFSKESGLVRYVSDSSYWLYIMHLPLVIQFQAWVRDSNHNPGIKFFLITSAIFVSLLASYQLFVRHTPIGWLLNGKRQRLYQN